MWCRLDQCRFYLQLHAAWCEWDAIQTNRGQIQGPGGAPGFFQFSKLKSPPQGFWPLLGRVLDPPLEPAYFEHVFSVRLCMCSRQASLRVRRVRIVLTDGMDAEADPSEAVRRVMSRRWARWSRSPGGARGSPRGPSPRVGGAGGAGRRRLRAESTTVHFDVGVGTEWGLCLQGITSWDSGAPDAHE